MMKKCLWPFASLSLVLCGLLLSADAAQKDTPHVAAIVTAYYKNSHADVIVSRLLQTDSLDGQGRPARVKLVSLYVDQFPDRDISRTLAGEHGVPIYSTIPEALTLGTGKLAVDGVLLIAEHGKYPKSETGNTQYPKRRFFDETIKVFKASDRVVPIYVDKHVADNWADIQAIYQTAETLRIPMMAGSVLPLAPRKPTADVKRGEKLKQIVVISYHTLDGYGFHALEIVQSLAERRAGGETGIEAVRCLSGAKTWTVLDEGACDVELFKAALERLPKGRNRGRPIRQAARRPSVMIIEYADGLKGFVFTLNGVAADWTAAWRTQDDEVHSVLYVLQDERPFMHFALLTRAIEDMVITAKSRWPLRRTVLVSGALDELLRSHKLGGKRIETPALMVRYESNYDWTAPTQTK